MATRHKLRWPCRHRYTWSKYEAGFGGKVEVCALCGKTRRYTWRGICVRKGGRCGTKA